MNNSEIRKKIQEINKKPISQKSKSREIFDLLNKTKPVVIIKVPDCTHYTRKCNIIAKCCGNKYGCRFCHNENEDHDIDRFSTEQIECKICNTVQDVSNKCISCSIEFDDYFCSKCILWKNNDGKNIAKHCDKCKICRVSEHELTHCDDCNLCFPKETYDTHECSKSYIGNCCICKNGTFDSSDTSVLLVCKHVMHSKCLAEYLKTNYRCPLCRVSLYELSAYWDVLRLERDSNTMPEEYNEWKTDIFCNDCNKKNIIKYHFVYNECPECKGFNTQINNIIKTELENVS